MDYQKLDLGDFFRSNIRVPVGHSHIAVIDSTAKALEDPKVDLVLTDILPFYGALKERGVDSVVYDFSGLSQPSAHGEASRVLLFTKHCQLKIRFVGVDEVTDLGLSCLTEESREINSLRYDSIDQAVESLIK